MKIVTSFVPMIVVGLLVSTTSNAIIAGYELTHQCDVRRALCAPERTVMADEPPSSSSTTDLFTTDLVVTIATSVPAGSFFKVY
jgi:hypothetical protein